MICPERGAGRGGGGREDVHTEYVVHPFGEYLVPSLWAGEGMCVCVCVFDCLFDLFVCVCECTCIPEHEEERRRGIRAEITAICSLKHLSEVL